MSWLKNIFGGGPITKDKFADLAIKARVKNGETRKLLYDKDDFCLRVVEANGVAVNVLYLQNAYEEYCQVAPEARQSVLDTYCAPMSEPPESLDDSIAYILPRIQPRSYFEDLTRMNAIENAIKKTKNSPLETPYAVLAEHMCISLVFDAPQSISYLAKPKLDKWNTTLEELMPRAITNLHRLTPEPFQPFKPGIYMSPYFDTHDASRIMLRERVAECRIKGRPIAMMANRNSLVITGEDDEANLKVMIGEIEEQLKQPRPLPPFPLVYDEESKQWQIWQAPRNYSCHQEFDLFIVRAFMDIYGSQKELLEKLHDADKTDVFVATYQGIQSQDGEAFSNCVWSENVDSWLPKTEKISFVEFSGGSGKPLGMANWDEVAAAVGDAIQPMNDMYPPRYHVNGFPTKEQLANIKLT